MTQISGTTATFFKSHDLGLIACLLARGFSLFRIEPSPTGRALFWIEYQDGLNQAIEGYWAFECGVDAQTYFNQLKRLKNQIYSLQ